MRSATDLTDRIERLEVFEERAGVSFEALYCTIDNNDHWSHGNYHVDFRGELHSSTGTTIQNDISVVLTVYDTAGRVLDTNSEWIDSDTFFGFEVLDMTLRVPPTAQIGRVRVFPKKN